MAAEQATAAKPTKPKVDMKNPHKYSKRQQFNIMRSQMANDRSSFEPTWRDCNDFILPTRARFFLKKSNDGSRQNLNIVDSTATFAVGTLSSGMMAGITSPARPWFRLGSPDPDLAEVSGVKVWLNTVGTRMSQVLGKSNLYKVLPSTYEDLGTFGNSPIYVEEDVENVLHFKSLPVGTYFFAADSKGRVNRFLREFDMTVYNIVNEFAVDPISGEINWENVSTHVRSLYERSMFEEKIDVANIVLPNPDYIPDSPFSKYKKYQSCYFEIGSGAKTNYMDMSTNDSGKILQEEGYDFFPYLTPRWRVTGQDAYSTWYPGVVALGDVKQLQTGERGILKAMEYSYKPPMTAPSSLQNAKTTILPGDTTYSDAAADRGFRPTYLVDPRIQEMEMKQAQVRQRIDRAFFADLFLKLINSDQTRTATEVEAIDKEKLLALGPVLEQLNGDLLDPIIDITYYFMELRGLIPEPPPELQGVSLKIEYISIMAQAQKMLGIQTQERFMNTVIALGASVPSIMDKVDFDQFIDVYGDNLSLPPGIVRTDEQTASIRNERAKAQQAQNTAAMLQQGAATAKDLSQADLGNGDNALKRVLDTAQAGALT